jgi:hypothetical protein
MQIPGQIDWHKAIPSKQVGIFLAWLGYIAALGLYGHGSIASTALGGLLVAPAFFLALKRGIGIRKRRLKRHRKIAGSTVCIMVIGSLASEEAAPDAISQFNTSYDTLTNAH